MYFHRAACAIILCLVAEALGLGSSTERSSNKLEAEDAVSTKPTADLTGDNVADSSVTSYSSIVIHHSPGKSKGGDAPEDQDKQASRSESYFKISNLHGKSGSGRTRDEKSHRRPSFSTSSSSSSSSSSSALSPASTSSLRSEETKNHRIEPLRTKLRDVSTDNFKSFPKIKHFEGDFRPIEGPTTEEPRRPQRLVNHHYNPHHHESSEEDVSTSLASSQEIFRKEPKYREYDHSDEYSSSEHFPSAEDVRPKFRKGYKDDKKHGSSFRDDGYRKPFYSEEYRKPLQTEEYRKPFHTEEYNKPLHSEEFYKHQSDEYRKPLHGGNYKHYSDAPDYKINDYSSIYKSSAPRLNGPTPPPGMSEELMETLLQQEPQKFSDGEKSIKSYPSKKKFKSAGGDNPTAFNVGYSIGFGGPPSDDVVFGKPKEQGLKLHVNGEKSVWKQLNSGVEMSQNLDKGKPLQYRVPDATPRPKINVLKNGGSSVYYVNNNSPEIENIPTVGKSTFDHNHALTHTNFFDFSNAMQTPIALPLTSNIVPEAQPYGSKPKAGRNLDVMSLYQSMGYSPPIPVMIPNGPNGEAQMVHAIVIPLQNVPNVDLGWGQLQGMFPGPGLVAGSSAPQPIHFAPVSPVPQNVNPVQQNSAHHNSVHHSGLSFKTNHHNSHINHHPLTNQFPAIPEKIRTPKYRKAKDTFKSGSAFSSPIVVSPVHQGSKRDLQRELNAILAHEMSRKNHRHTPLGLRPPPPQQ